MSEELDVQKLKNEYSEFFKQFSPEFVEFIFSKEISSKIAEICSENGIEDEEKVEKIAYRVILVLFNQIPKENFTKILMNGVGLDFNTANQISLKVNELIFSQAPKLEPKEIQKEKKMPVIGEVLGLTEFLKKEEIKSKQEKTEKPYKKDPYRETPE